MTKSDGSKVYDALALPNEAIAFGGAEILRVGVIRNNLYVTARSGAQDPAIWGKLLAELTSRLAALCAAAASSRNGKDVQTQIAEAYVAAMGMEPETRKSKPGAVKQAPKRAAKRAAAAPRRKKR
jgi:Domain of unknown function (DUF5076)